MTTPRRHLVALLATVLLGASTPASADIGRFDLAGRIYTKWLYRNDDSQGVLTWGNPFWPDNVSGHNGVGSEFELKILGAVSRAVRAEVRLKSRFGALWQDWWENGDQAYDEVNTSGESLGMNHAQYMKLRGYYIEANLPIPTVRSVLVGSSDLGMFNPWTIGKVRYIDRDNAKGTFVTGGSEDGTFGYVLAAIALPKLFAGPGWSTGIGDPKLRTPFWSRDWAYAAKLTAESYDVGTFTLIGSITRDSEVDVSDPDAQGSVHGQCRDALGNPIEGCEKDYAVEAVQRYSNAVATLEYEGLLFDVVGVEALAAISSSDVNEDVAFNGVEGNAGVAPIVFDDVVGHAAKLRIDLYDPFEIGLSFKLEGFSIGEHFNSIFGARREADVLLTDGFIEGGQLPTMNIANEFMDFDEPWYESAIGWVGATVVPEMEFRRFTLSAEATFIGYHTNAQERDVESTYPDFLHADGFTDTDLYDFPNATDRGRDPRSVFRRNQDRHTWIAVLRGRWEPDWALSPGLDVKLKAILDRDDRSHTTEADDYRGTQLIGRLAVDARVTDALKLGLGTKLEHWDEDNRRGTLELGYGDDTTDKAKAFVSVLYTWSGFNFAYYLEYLHKDQRREREPDQLWDVFRSKATLEVVW
ncbi:MAG: hypothetical protein ACQEXJ_08155 [Myxococcota bacterium]